ncbi:globin family protein [Luteolibacter marinus]|uniref:globin family protein n=1 Tax=Luteolibacter marinus TaxID=2776705 RepID=UPI0018675CFB|nr:globin family protein [Luteolibacter marinus]
MTEDQKTLVQESWELVVPISDAAAELFYARLFELDPDLKPLFANADMKEQGKKLMMMITTAVRGLGDLGQLVGAIQAMGKRHVGYGVKAEHYDTVGSALLDTLEKGLGEAWTPAHKDAWALTYTTLATVMKDASYGSAS